jgi:ATP-dependent helicase HrpA
MSNAIRDGYKLLTELGAIDEKGKLTHHGQIMATLPIDPCIARIIIAARENNCLREIKIIAAALAIPDPRVRPAQQEQEADTAHRTFAHPNSDFLALLAIWDRFHAVQDQVKSWSRLKKFCAGHFLSFQRMREWLDLHEQLDRLLTLRPGFSDNSSPASYEAIHQSLCTGFLRNIAMKSLKPKDQSYIGGGGIELMIFPGSHLSRSKWGQQKTEAGEQSKKIPEKIQAMSNQWIMAASFLETTRLYAMTVAAIDQEWLETLGGSLCRKSWSNPRWHKKSGQVVANEKVTLFGLVIVANRKVNYGRIDKDKQEEARQIFIQSALITGEIENPFPFLQHNLKLLAEWQETEERLRKRDIVVDDRMLFAFYEQRLPQTVYDRFTLHRFLQKLKEKKNLEMTEDDILNRRPEHQELSDFPPLLTVGSHQFRLEYNFSPGAKDDGVTVRLPLNLIETLHESFFEWVVPGLLKEKVALLLKGLPKNIRKHLIPLNNTVDLLLDDLELYKGSLHQALERSVLKAFRRNIVRADWPAELPAHLSMRFLIFDQTGAEMATGRSLAKLRKELLQHSTATSTGIIANVSSQNQKIKQLWEEKLCATWDFHDLPSSLPLLSPQGESCGFLFPALKPIKDRGGVMIEFIPHQKEAVTRNGEGLNFLYQLHEAEQYKSLKKYCATSLSAPSSSWLTQGLGDRAQVLGALLSFILRALFHTGNGRIPDQETFNKIVSQVKGQGFYNAGRVICDTVMITLRQRRELSAHIHRFADLARKNRSFSRTRFDEYQGLMMEILPFNFLTSFELAEAQGCGQQMKALMIRIERAFVDPAKDALKAAQLKTHLQNLHQLHTMEKDLPVEAISEMKKYQEMIAHYRIAIFAPEIQGKIQVSAKKLEQQWQELSRHISIKSR